MHFGHFPGQEVVFHTTDIGKKRVLNRQLIARENLVPRVRAQVVYIHSINYHITNGGGGEVVSFLYGLPVVASSAETTNVDGVTWSEYDRDDPTGVMATKT